MCIFLLQILQKLNNNKPINTFNENFYLFFFLITAINTYKNILFDI